MYKFLFFFFFCVEIRLIRLYMHCFDSVETSLFISVLTSFRTRATKVGATFLNPTAIENELCKNRIFDPIQYRIGRTCPSLRTGFRREYGGVLLTSVAKPTESAVSAQSEKAEIGEIAESIGHRTIVLRRTHTTASRRDDNHDCTTRITRVIRRGVLAAFAPKR